MPAWMTVRPFQRYLVVFSYVGFLPTRRIQIVVMLLNRSWDKSHPIVGYVSLRRSTKTDRRSTRTNATTTLSYYFLSLHTSTLVNFKTTLQWLINLQKNRLLNSRRPSPCSTRTVMVSVVIVDEKKKTQERDVWREKVVQDWETSPLPYATMIDLNPLFVM